MATKELMDALSAAMQEQAAGAPAGASEPAEGTVPTGTEAQAGEQTPTPSSTGAQTDVEAQAAGTESEAQAAAAAEGTEDVPESYFGVDLSDLPAEGRAEIIRGFAERDNLINKLLREQAATTEETRSQPSAVTTPQPEQPTEMSDEDLAKALGLDLEDPFDSNSAKTAIPLARMVLELNQRVQALDTTSTAERTQRLWETSLDTLEKEYGPLPVPRIKLYEYAVENSIADPSDAYWRVMGPVTRQVLAEATARRKAVATAAKQAAATTRPRASAPTEPVALESKDTKSAVAEGLKQVLEEKGIVLPEF